MAQPLSDLPPETNALDLLSPDIGWCVVQPWPGQEKEVARRLLLLPNLVYYLPYGIHRTSGRNTVSRPLFSGYLFVGECGFKPQADYPTPPEVIRQIHDISRTSSGAGKCRRELLPVRDQTSFRQSLSNLQKNRPEAVVPLPEKGRTVRVLYPHKLVGQLGIVEDARPDKVLIEFPVLGQALRYPIDPEDIEVIA